MTQTWAGDEITRKSTSCVAESHGDHLVDLSISKQEPLALSSGEAEFLAIVKGCSMGKQTIQICEGLGMPVSLEILSDSSAARGMCQRQGTGSKVRHMAMKDLWVQEFFRKNEAELKKVLTDDNWADIGTKYLDRARLEKLIAKMPLTRREGWTGSMKALAMTILAAQVRRGESSQEVVSFPTSSTAVAFTTATGQSDFWWKALMWYILVLHIFAVIGVCVTCRRSNLTCAVTVLQRLCRRKRAHTGATGAPAGNDNRKWLIGHLTVKEIQSLLSARGCSQSGLKSELIVRLLRSQPRASDRQLDLMASLKRQDQRLEIAAVDVSTVERASQWITSAKGSVSRDD